MAPPFASPGARVLWLACLVLSCAPAGCVDDDHGNPYAPGESGYAPPFEDDGGSDDGEAPPDLPADDEGGSTTGGDGDGDGDGDTGAGTSGGGTAGGGTTGGATCSQPVAGMFAPCLEPAQCGGLACFQVKQGDAVTDGFCTATCSNASECGPAPGDCSATPACVPVGGQSACALSCAGGASCPAGMQCKLFQDSGEVCV